jgi:hypothetical protein
MRRFHYLSGVAFSVVSTNEEKSARKFRRHFTALPIIGDVSMSVGNGAHASHSNLASLISEQSVCD